MILGIDEVGRGSWAGPLVVGAVVLGGEIIDGLTDSKKLSKKRREQLDIEIRNKARGIGLGWVEAAEIDEIGLSESLNLATKRAVEQIKAPYSEIIIDGTVNFLLGTNKEQYVTTIKKADLLIPCVSAASIVAKVARDNYMATMDIQHKGYNFRKHVGYGTIAHCNEIDKYGATNIHRMSFAPLKNLKNTNKVTTKQVGDRSEDVAAIYLKNIGHEIIERNWKTKYCEIDIVSKNGDSIFFTEVKYRKIDKQGDGLDVINKKKINKMKFAARFFAHYYNINDVDLRLAAISTADMPPRVIEFVEV